MGIGTGKGKTRAVDAALAAISSPLLDFPITRAKGIVFNIVGGCVLPFSLSLPFSPFSFSLSSLSFSLSGTLPLSHNA